MNKGFKYIFLLLIIIFLVGCNNQAQVNNNKEISNKSSSQIGDKLDTDYSNFNGFDMPKDNVSLKIDGKTLNFTLPIYLNKNRYYFPLNEIISDLNGDSAKSENSLNLKINGSNYSINTLDNTVKCPDKTFTLKEKLITDDHIYYLGFSDLANMLNLYTRWDKDNKIINFKTNGVNMDNVTPYNSKDIQIGFIRFEDICLSSEPYDKYYFENLRIIASYMNQKKVSYHIAWIPRYINPKHNIDNDPITKNNFELAEMVYTLDYFKTHNGIIGLHGYTHQCGNHESAIGFEFGKFEPSVDVFKEKITKAIETASYLDIPIDFFEVPHYEITPEQNKIAEKYFKILYYPFNDNGIDKADLTKPQLSPYNNSSYYISTPLGYIAQGKEATALAKIKKADTSKMGSVFYHPRLENNFISLSEDSKGLPTFTYNDNSTLKKLIAILQEKGFKMIDVTSLK
ncbi:DUF2334 domain-containing protein [Clostridium uliginosum]|uniref:DUF2334 domain-containing protein n=1 Tax=Clostridium uliginosum TaxID=119641 RepID=UPI0015882171|nr:DUF2334 domain-containing protein [Clostridium uliginosum]